MKTDTAATPVLKIERLLNATPEKLWTYWTDPRKYAKWLNPSPADLVVHEWDLRVGGRVRFDMPQPDGNKNPQSGVFHELDPPRRLVTGEPDKSFLIEVDLVPAGRQTRMVVTVKGLPPEWHAPATEGWGRSLDKLEAQLGQPSAVPKTSGANQGFTIERTFRAGPEKVWRMWTTKEGIERWWAVSAKEMGFDMTVRSIDLRVGGRYSFELRHGDQVIHNHGTYTEVTPHRRLAWTWNFDIFLAPGEAPYDVPISVELTPIPQGTKMTFRQGPLATAEFTEGSRQGVIANFEKLAKALEGA